MTPRLVAAALVLVVSVVTVAGPAPSVEGANTIPFTPKFRANANGAIITIGNNLLTCAASANNCAAARGGGSADNNGFDMVDLDADGVAGTANSSMSRLDLPAGATVLWAGLYWGARLQAGDRGTGGSANAINTMRLRVPGASGYQTITASGAARDQFGPNNASFGAYQRFADVTSIVGATGNGDYWGADVEAADGEDRYAGWTLTVVYTAPGLPLRNLTVFDGFNVVSGGNSQTINVSGFQAPQAGTVDMQLTMVAYQGDLDQTGDFTRLNSTQLATPLSPGSNFFASTNGLDGASVTTRTPADRNMLGFDIKNLGASGAIPNNAESATFRFSSNGDIYYPGVLGMAINLYAPDFTASAKTVVNLNGNSPSRPDDTLQYTLSYSNTGQDPAIQVVSEDVLPPDTTYVPGSLALVNPLTGATTPLTDGAGDDVGEVAGRTVRVRLGTGATATSGGTLNVPGPNPLQNRAAYIFEVRLDDAAGGTTVTNIADLDYRTATTNIPATYTTNPASVDVITRANVSITKEMTPDPAAIGSDITGTITITNNGPNTAQNVTMRDPLIDGWTNDSLETPPGVTCTVGTVINCNLGNIPNGASVTIRAHGHMASNVSQPTLTNVASTSTDSLDPDLTNNVASDTIALLRTADLEITKTASPTTAPGGGVIAYTLSVTNNGASDAQDVVISDLVDNPALLSLTTVTGTTGGATCPAPQGSSLRCTVATLVAGATATVTVEGVLNTRLDPGILVRNTATVTAATADPDSSNNRATSQVTTDLPMADLQLTKTGPASVVAGTPISYTLVASNAGPSDARFTAVTDVIPVEITATSVSTSRGSCQILANSPSPGRQQLVCTFIALPAGASATITLTGTVAAGVTAEQIVNTATVESDTTDPAPGNNEDTANNTVTRASDVAVSKRANRTSLPGAAPDDPRPVDYTITVTNNGPSAAMGVTLTDLIPVPEGLVFLDATAEGGTCTDPVPTGDPDHDQLTCALDGAIPVGGTRTIVVNLEARADLGAAGVPLTETATVSAPGDDNAANDTATWTLTGDPQSDLELLKTAPPEVTAGAVMTYTFTITNHPPNPEEEALTALAPTLIDTLPDGVTLVPAGAPSSVTPVWCTAEGQTVTCEPPRPDLNIPPDTTLTIEFSVLVAPDVAAGTSLVNNAEVVNDPVNPDPTPGNNFSQATSSVAADADVVITGLTATPRDPASTGPGSWRDITFTLSNAGPSVARDVQFRVAIELDAAADLSTLPSNCVLAEGELVCTINGNDLAPGQSTTISFGALIAGYVTPRAYLLGAQVSSSTPDSNLTNNDASTTIDVGTARTDLQIEKTAVDTVPNPNDGHPSFVAGQPFAFEIAASVPNDPGLGLADAQDVALTDSMPAGFTATLVSTTRGTCDVTGGGTGVSCELGTVAAWPGGDDPVVVTVFGFVDVSGEGEQFTNTATATSSTFNQAGLPTSVSDSTAVDVIEQADLRLFKEADAPTFSAGGSVGFALTTVNTGPSDVENASITDTLPAGLTLDPANSPGCTVNPANEQQVTCLVGAVGVGQSVTIRVVATTSPNDTPRTITNTATVTSQATDPVLDNNSASAITAIDRLADVGISSAVSTTTPAAGGEITYTGVSTSSGPSSAWNTTGRSVFPPGFVPVSFDVPFNTCTWTPAAPADPTTVPWADISYVLDCEPADPSGPFEPGLATTSVVVMYIPATPRLATTSQRQRYSPRRPSRRSTTTRRRRRSLSSTAPTRR